MKNIFYLAIFLICFTEVEAQSPAWTWAKCIGENYTDMSNCFTTDKMGNVYITGNFYSDTISFGNTTFTNTGDCDIYLAKFDPEGNILWARHIGGSNYEGSNCITTDNLGNVYITGGFSDPVITIGNTTLYSMGFADSFIAKYDSNGNIVWAKSAGGAYADEGISISTDSMDNVYVTGNYYSSVLSFDYPTTLQNSGGQDVFIAKYNANGILQWARSAGGNGDDFSKSLITVSNGDIYLAGDYKSSFIFFGNLFLENTVNTNFNDIFIARYDSTGEVLWVKNEGGHNDDFANCITIDAKENLYMVGSFRSSTITIGNTTLTNMGEDDIFITKYSPNGNILWSKSAGGEESDYGLSIVADKLGNSYIAGAFISPTIPFGNDTISNKGSFDIYITCLDSLGSFLWAKDIGGSGFDYSCNNSMTINNLGNIYLTGYFSSSDFALDSISLINDGGYDIFITKLNIITTNNSPICEGTRLLLNAFSDPEAAYSWTGPNGYSSNQQNPVVSDSATINMSGRYRVVVSKNGLNSIGFTNVLINPIPDVPIAGNNGPVCENTTLSLTASEIPNAIYSWTGPNGFHSTLQNPVVSDSTTSLMAGIYYVTSNVNGCISGAGQTTVNVNPLPSQPSVSQEGTNLVSSFAKSYQWYFNGNAIDGDTLQICTPLQNGIYTVATTDDNKCSAMSLPFSLINYGINEENTDNTIIIFPNPTLQNFSIAFPVNTRLINIFNVSGEIIQKKDVYRKTNANFSITEKGVYFIHIITDEQSIIKKLIIK